MEETSLFIEQRRNLLQLLIVGSYAVWPILGLALLTLRRSKRQIAKIFVGFVIILCLIFIYMRFIERYWIQETYIEMDRGWEARVVLIADQHLGHFKNSTYMDKVVSKINNIPDVDFVVVAGDFTYWPVDLAQEHRSLANLQHPTYAVLGNHDEQPFGILNHKTELTKLLTNLGVIVLENDIVETEAGVTVYGLGSHGAHLDDVEILQHITPDQNALILTHNPDTTRQKYPAVDLSHTVTMTGHTHCGQVRIPGLYQHIIPTVGDFPDRGPYDLKNKGTLLVTCGLGEVLLPLRLFNPPEIMVVNL